LEGQLVNDELLDDGGK